MQVDPISSRHVHIYLPLLLSMLPCNNRIVASHWNGRAAVHDTHVRLCSPLAIFQMIIFIVVEQISTIHRSRRSRSLSLSLSLSLSINYIFFRGRAPESFGKTREVPQRAKSANGKVFAAWKSTNRRRIEKSSEVSNPSTANSVTARCLASSKENQRD